MTVKIGILGGGQLAQMLIEAGQNLDLEFIIYAEAPTYASENLADSIYGKLDDFEQLDRLLSEIDIVALENENIPSQTIAYIQDKGYPINGNTLIHAQDRLLEKNLFLELNIPTNKFMAIDSSADASKAGQVLGFPFIIKTRRDGYDGKGQYRIKSQDQLAELLEQKDLTNTIAEEFISFEREVSVIAVANQQAEIRAYPLSQNEHKNGILHKTINIDEGELLDKASDCISKIIKHFNYVGVLALELFVKDGQLYANEMAPRVHNSGHWTIEGTDCSQFENHLRAIANMPLGTTKATTQAKMINIIGQMPDLSSLEKQKNIYIHDYHKQPRPARKLAHLTITNCNESSDEVQAVLDELIKDKE